MQVSNMAARSATGKTRSLLLGNRGGLASSPPLYQMLQPNDAGRTVYHPRLQPLGVISSHVRYCRTAAMIGSSFRSPSSTKSSSSSSSSSSLSVPLMVSNSGGRTRCSFSAAALEYDYDNEIDENDKEERDEGGNDHATTVNDSNIDPSLQSHGYDHSHNHSHGERMDPIPYTPSTHTHRHGDQYRDQSTVTLTQTQTHSQPLHEPVERFTHLPRHSSVPPPPAEPKYSFHRRTLPPNLLALSSPRGRAAFLESLASLDAESYFPLAEQFATQGEPAYCGITSLVVVLNAMGVDPNVRWRGGWRWYEGEDSILGNCCIDNERVRRIGISLEEFGSLARCQGLNVELKRPHPLSTPSLSLSLKKKSPSSLPLMAQREPRRSYSLQDFRRDVLRIVRGGGSEGHLVTSFSRSSLGQTGDGHFSPVAAYHSPTDSCLVLDVARFKYAPYWVSMKELYESMRPEDDATGLSRGWFVLKPPGQQQMDDDGSTSSGLTVLPESPMEESGMRPASHVPPLGGGHACPVGEIQVMYCPARGMDRGRGMERSRVKSK